MKTEYHLRPLRIIHKTSVETLADRAESFIHTPRARADWLRLRQVEYEVAAAKAVQKC